MLTLARIVRRTGDIPYGDYMNAKAKVEMAESLPFADRQTNKPKHTAAAIADLLLLPLWTTENVGIFLDTAPETVRSWRRTGSGPKFIYLTPRAVRYRCEDVQAWLAGNERTSTSQSDKQANKRAAGQVA